MHALRLASEPPALCSIGTTNYGNDPNRPCLLPLQQSSEAFLHRMFEWIIRRSSPARWGNEHVRNLRRQGSGSADELCAISTIDTTGRSVACGQGRFTRDPPRNLRGAGVVEIPRLQESYSATSERFEHHGGGPHEPNAARTRGASKLSSAGKSYWHK